MKIFYTCNLLFFKLICNRKTHILLGLKIIKLSCNSGSRTLCRFAPHKHDELGRSQYKAKRKKESIGDETLLMPDLKYEESCVGESNWPNRTRRHRLPEWNLDTPKDMHISMEDCPYRLVTCTRETAIDRSLMRSRTKYIVGGCKCSTCDP